MNLTHSLQRPRLTKPAVDKFFDSNPDVRRKDKNRVSISGQHGRWEVYYDSNGKTFSAFQKDGTNNVCHLVDVKKDGVYIGGNSQDIYAPSYSYRPMTKTFEGKIPASESMRVGLNVLGSIVGLPVHLMDPNLATNVALKKL